MNDQQRYESEAALPSDLSRRLRFIARYLERPAASAEEIMFSVTVEEAAGKVERFDGRSIRLSRDEAEFLVNVCEQTRIPQWMQLAADIRRNWGMGPFPAGSSLLRELGK